MQRLRDMAGQVGARVVLCSDNILNHFAGLLTEIRSRPQAKMFELSTTSMQDLARVKSWNALPPEPMERYIQDLIRQHTDSQPKAPAVEA